MFDTPKKKAIGIASLLALLLVLALVLKKLLGRGQD